MQVKRRNLTRFLGLWIGSSGFYWWLIGRNQAEQLIAATVIGLVAGVALVVLAARAGLHFEFKVRWLAILLQRLPGRALRDVVILTVELCHSLAARRGSTGTLKELPFVSGGEDAESRGRRTLVTSGISLPPNTIAISAQSSSDTILVHQLVFRGEAPVDKEWPL